jgi:DNA polymerase
LITRFCKPRKPSKKNPKRYFEPEDDREKWEEFIHYNRRDVVAEAAVARKLSPYPWTQDEHSLWLWDRVVNLRGLPMDIQVAQEADLLVEKYTRELLDRIILKTGWGVENPNSRDQVLSWLQSEGGVNIPDLSRKTLETWVQRDDVSPLAKEVMHLRLSVSQSATKKYAALLQKQCAGRLQDTLQPWGAGRTGRWAGRGFQLQNLKRPPKGTLTDVVAESIRCGTFDAIYGGFSALEYLGGSIRSIVKAGPGKLLVVSDLSAIESRFVGWLTDCLWINGIFEKDLDTYKAFASDWLGVPYDQVTKDQRNEAKPPFLGFAYRLGGKSLKTYAEGMGIDLTEDQCQSAIKAARDRCPEIVHAWTLFEVAAETALRTRDPIRILKCVFQYDGVYLRVTLPSGRDLFYFEPRWEETTTPWGRRVWQMTYMGQNQITGKWQRLTNHGGRFIEQITQGGARDILAGAMIEYTKLGGYVVGHVHDEMIAEEEAESAEHALQVMNSCLTKTPDWASGMILKSEGYVAERYGKR